ncbi:MAG TPA: MFS transporter [Planctomycetota bacterium]|nr:MFS transporter [Planctomycetota bacterium]
MSDSPATAAPPLPLGLNVRLSLMMFLQYAIWGAWLPFLWSYLADHRGFSGSAIGDMFAAGAVGAIVGPFIAGQFADRYFATEKFLAASHLAGAVLVWQLARADTYREFLVLSLLYGLVYAPTLALTNSLAFHHLPDRDRDFGRVRLWGTFGWIAVGIALGQWLALAHTPDGAPEVVQAAQVAGKADAFVLSAVLGVAMGLYCLTLPHTPPARGAQRSATAEALGEVRRQPLLTLFLLAVPVSCIHQFYFVHTESFLHARLEAPAFFRAVFGVGGGGFMTIGQMSEVLVLAAIPLLARRVSRKTFLGVGLAAYGLRMALFAYADQLPLPNAVPLLLGVALHGLCFGCFVFVAFMVVDERTTPDVRASAQNLFNLVIVGVGVIVGSKLAGLVAEWAGDDYTKLFSVPMWASLGCLAALLAFYPGRRRVAVSAEA